MFLLFSNWIVIIRDTDGQRGSHNTGDLWGGFVLYQVLRSSFTGGTATRCAPQVPTRHVSQVSAHGVFKP